MGHQRSGNATGTGATHFLALHQRVEDIETVASRAAKLGRIAKA